MCEEISSLTSEEKLKLATWGLPKSILQRYAEKGIVNMFQWQVECLCSQGVLTGGNLVYSAPTSAGKTLVAEILAIKTILERKKKVFFILPFVSVVREKMLYFKELLSSCGVHVHGFMGSHAPPGGFKTTNLAVCTIEKANSLINRLVEEHELEQVGCVIVDELHLLGDPHRGYLLELLLAKIKYISSRECGVKVQVIGMSATLPNLNLLADWLNAALYCTEFRPVPLTEYLKVESAIYRASDHNRSSLKLPDFDIKDDPGDIIKLCIDTLLGGHSALVFCPTKNWCEALAQQIAMDIRRIGCGSSDLGVQLRSQLNTNAITDLLEQLKRCPVGLESVLGKCASFGVAYHHAGLTLDERDILESSFRQCTLRILVATSTLSSGVNLPARRVIVRSPLFGGRPIDILTYKQMIGRAGRMGKDTAGESFLVCKSTEKKIGEMLVGSELPSVQSCLGLGDLSSSLKRAVLEVIASGVVSSLRDVEAYTSCTLFAASKTINDSCELEEPISACIEFLQTNEFIRVLEGDQISPTNLGEACLSAALPPDQALRLLSELHRARQCFVLDSELHIIYQVTPFSVSEQWRQLDWMSALNLWENLSPSMQRVGELIGVEERFLVRAIRGNINTNSSAQMEKLSIFRRFYTALALQDLVNEVPLVKVAEKYKCSKGMLQSLQQSASTFAGMVTQFCRRLGWSSIELLVSQFADRLQFGVQRDLLDLLRIDCISAIQARALFNSDIKNLSELANSKITEVEKSLRKAVPFESEKVGTTDIGNGKHVWLAGRASLTEREAATLIINEARSFLQTELGLKSVNWSDNLSGTENTGNDINSEINDVPIVNCKNESDTSSLSSLSEISNSEKSNFENDCLKLNKNNVINSSNSMNISDKQELETCLTSSNEMADLNISSKYCVVKNSTSNKSNHKRNSVDMFENSSDESESEEEEEEEKNSKFKDVICSLSLYESKVSKIHSENEDVLNERDIFSGHNHHEEEKIPYNKLIVHDERNNIEIKDTNKINSPTNNCSNNQPGISTQCKNILKNICFGNWESLTEIKNSEQIEQSTMDCKEINLKNCIKELKNMPILNTKSPHVLNSNKINKALKHELIKSPDSKISLNGPIKESVEEDEYNKTGKEIIRKSLDIMEPLKSPNRSNNINKTSTPKFSTPVFNKSTPIIPNSFKKFNKILPNEILIMSKDFMLSNENTLFNNFKSCTPIDNTIGQSIVNSSNNVDFFDHSPVGNCSNISNQLNTALSNHSLENMDVNWGGESILQNSMLILDAEEIVKKRKRSFGDDDLTNCKKLRLSNYEFLDNDGVKNKLNSQINYFGDCDNNNDIKNSVKKVIYDEQSEVFVNSLVVQNNTNNFFGSLNIDSQMCNVLDTVDTINKCKNVSVANSQDSSQISSSQCNELTKCDKNGDNNLQNNHRKNLPKNICMIPERKVNDEFKVTESILETAAGFQTVIDFANRTKLITPEKVTQMPMKLNCTKSELFRNNANVLKTSNSILKIDVTSSRSEINDVTVNNGTLNEQNESQEEMDDLIISSQEEPTMSSIRVYTRSMVLKSIKTCTNVPNSSVSHLERIETENVCNNSSKLDNFKKLLSKKKVVSVSLNIMKKGEDVKEGIGARLLARRHSQINKEGDFSFGMSVICGIAVYWGTDKIYYLDIRRSECPCVEIIKDLFSRDNITIIMNDLKSQVKLLHQCCHFDMKCQGSDPVIADWLLIPNERRKSLRQMLKVNNLKCPLLNDERNVVREAVELWQLNSYFQTKLKKANLLTAYKDIEMPIQFCLCNMELAGFGFDKDYAELLWDRLEIRMAELLEIAYQIAGRKFNPRSKADLNKVQKLLSEDSSKQDELSSIVQKWRKLNTLKTRCLNPFLLKTESRLYGDCITTTQTGRVSMHEPNLQNVPKDVVIDDEVFSMRTAFIPAPGSVLVSADYCQLELRILAHFSEDKALLEAFHSSSDIFISIASSWHKIPETRVTAELRHHTKQICYGLIYGMGVTSLSEQMELPEEEAKKMMDSFRLAYPGLQMYIVRCVDTCRTTKEVHTLFNRVRFLPEIISTNSSLRSQAERQAVNTTIQGSAADIAKRGMLKVEASLQNQCPNAKLVLQLHDELIYEVPEDGFETAVNIIKKEMETAWELRVPLPVKVKAGPSWGQLEVLRTENS